MKIKLLFIFTFFVGLITTTQTSHALISLSPKNPRANSQVTLTLSSYNVNIDTSIVTWKADGVTILSGQGEKKVSLTLGDIGRSILVIVTAENADGSSVEERITLSPSSITLLYEAPKSYVPLLYEGRSLPATGGVVRVTALPQMSDGEGLLSPSNLSYTWYVDDEVIKSSSGLGKQAINLRLNFIKSSQVVKVVVRSPKGNESQESVTIYPHEVMPLLYRFDPLFGPLLGSLFGKRIETTSEFTVALEPYYVSINDEKDPVYTWYIDGLPSTPIDGRVLGFQPKADSYGSRTLLIDVVGGKRGLQQGQFKSEIIFDTRK